MIDTAQGVVLTEWPDAKIAQFAVKSLNGYSFDKNHIFTAHLFTEIKNLREPDDHWKIPEKQPYTDVGDLWWWMQNDRCRDQFAILYDKNAVPTVGVYTNMKGNDPELAGDPDKAERAVITVFLQKVIYVFPELDRDRLHLVPTRFLPGNDSQERNHSLGWTRIWSHSPICSRQRAIHRFLAV